MRGVKRDFTGQRIGPLLVLSIAGKAKNGNTTFHCRCDCGKEFVRTGWDLSQRKPDQKCSCNKRDAIKSDRLTKTCSHCQEEKSIKCFGLNKSRKDKHSLYCKGCRPLTDNKYRGRYNKSRNDWERQRRDNDPNFKLCKSLQGRIRVALHGKTKKFHTLEIIGCSIEKLREHLERQFRPGMTWENYGSGWHIDHIRPCSSFDLTDSEQQKSCFYYGNLQPLWAKENMSKGNKSSMDGLSIFGGGGFIGSHYALQYPDCCVEPRNTDAPTRKDVLYFISTTTNYNVFTDLKLDINTNLSKLLYVLPHVDGVFNYISTWFAYGKSGVGLTVQTAAKETDPCAPNGFYSITKFTAERYVESYCDMVDADLAKGPCGYRVLRLCGVIGNDPGANKQKNALEYMLRKVANGEDVEVYEGDNYRNIMHVSDVVRAIHLCINAEATLNSIINIGAPKSERMIDIIEYAKTKLGSPSKITRVPVPRFHQIVQVPDFFLNTDKLQSLGFVPEMTTYQAVDRVLEGILRGNAVDALSTYVSHLATDPLLATDPSEADTYQGLTLVDKGDTVAGHYLLARQTMHYPYHPEYWTHEGWSAFGEVFMTRAAAVAKRREIFGRVGET